MSEPTKQDVPVWSEWTNEQWVRAAVPDAQWIGHSSGTRIWIFSHSKGALSGWFYIESSEESAYSLAWDSARKHPTVVAYESRLRAEWEMREKERPMPTGGDPKDFCACGHHEMNHANYIGLPRACNQNSCECRSYVAEARDAEVGLTR